jgi:peptidoglycan/LPS O-acetylase OafA/YrhL
VDSIPGVTMTVSSPRATERVETAASRSISAPVDGVAKVARIDALTGLRIFPAFAVLLSHLGPPAWAPAQIKALFTAGYSGVTIFFVLSGFVLAHNYFDLFRNQLSFRLLWSYVVARIARVYPLYLLLLVWVSMPNLVQGAGRGPVWWQHVLAIQAWHPSIEVAYAFNGVGWSISVEFFLYACFPLLVFLFARPTRTTRGTVVLLVMTMAAMALVTRWFVVRGLDALPWSSPESDHRWLYRNPLCRLGDFSLGMLTARLVGLLPKQRWTVWLGHASILLGGAAIVLLMCWRGHALSAWSWDVSYAIPAACLIFGLASTPSSFISRALAIRPMLLLGEASYALYLSHVWMLAHFRNAPASSRNWWFVQGLTVFMVIVMAIGLHVSVEKVLRRLVRSVLDRSASRPDSPWLNPHAPHQATSE